MLIIALHRPSKSKIVTMSWLFLPRTSVWQLCPTTLLWDGVSCLGVSSSRSFPNIVTGQSMFRQLGDNRSLSSITFNVTAVNDSTSPVPLQTRVDFVIGWSRNDRHHVELSFHSISLLLERSMLQCTPSPLGTMETNPRQSHCCTDEWNGTRIYVPVGSGTVDISTSIGICSTIALLVVILNPWYPPLK